MPNMSTQFLKTIGNKFRGLPRNVAVQKILKQSISIGTAVVNVISATGIAGFKFNCPQREEILLQNEITDHYMDDGSVVQDHMIQRPIEITLNGLQGDYFYAVGTIEAILAKVTPAITLCTTIMPLLSPIAKQQKTLFQAAKAATGNTLKNLVKAEGAYLTGNYMDLFETFQTIFKLKSAQARAYMFFEALWKSQLPFTVETSWRRFDNMVVKSVKPIRDNNADITDFTITCKQVHFVSTTVIDLKNVSNLTRAQMAAKVSKGIDKGKKVDGV